MKKFKQTIGSILFFLLIGTVSIVIVLALDKSIERHEQVECQKWEMQDEQFENFYWTDWQLTQCEK